MAVGHGAWIFYQWLCHSPFPQLIHDSIIGSLAHHINLWINGSKKAEDPEAVAGMRLRKQRWVWAIWSTIACFVMGPWVASRPICMELNRWSWYVGTCITNIEAYMTCVWKWRQHCCAKSWVAWTKNFSQWQTSKKTRACSSSRVSVMVYWSCAWITASSREQAWANPAWPL